MQNADDAGASEVKFLVDYRSHSKEKLYKKKLSCFQGPSLLAWNNASFSGNDWDNIGKLYLSEKMEDKKKTGRFGIGFQSVHHITGEYYTSNIHMHNTNQFIE